MLVSKAPSPPASSQALSSPLLPQLHFCGEEGQVAEGLAGSFWSLLSYFHKPIIAHHLGRLRPCLSPIQPGGRGWGGGGRGGGKLGGRCSSTGITTCAFTRLPWERSVGAVLGWSSGVGCGGGRSASPHPSAPREGAGSCVPGLWWLGYRLPKVLMRCK